MPNATKRKVVIAIVILVVLAAVGVVWKRGQDLSNISKPALRAIPVRVTTANTGKIAVTAHYLGKIDSSMVVELSPRITANITEVKKREGDSVAAGETIIALDDFTLVNKTRALEADLRAAQSSLLAAESYYQTRKASFERNQRLYDQAAIALEAYEQSKFSADNANSQLIAARERIQVLEENWQASKVEQSYARIIAPFDGIITKRMAEHGEMAIPGKALLILQAVDRGYKITAQVPQDSANSIHTGTEVLLSSGDQKITAAVYKVYPALTQSSLAIVEIQVPSIPFGLPAGSVIGVDIVLNRVEGIIVPIESVVSNSKGDFVVVVEENDLVRQIPVQIVGRNSKSVAISGLEADKQVVVGQENQLMQLTTGKKVVISQNRSEGI